MGESDIVIDADVAEEIIVAFADGDVVSVLHDGGIVDDLLDAIVAASTEPDLTGVYMADDVDLIVGAWTKANVAGASGDGDRGRRIDIQSALKGAVGSECGGCGECEG